MNILVLGASGYIGRKLVRAFRKSEYNVRCLLRSDRDEKYFRDPGAEVSFGDMLHPESIETAFRNIDIVYYLIHSMGSGSASFEDLDRRAAENCRRLSERAGVKRIIYLGGLGRRDIEQSRHLRSRHEVGDILRAGSISVTEFRAAVIVGSGSISFEIIHHLVNRLPAMICPRWVYTRTQPIGVEDVLAYLTSAPAVPDSANKIIDIGGPEVLSYYDMMTAVSEVLGLKRYMIGVPVLSPRLSSYWIRLITPISIPIARTLIESLRYETVCENDLAGRMFDIKPISFRVAVRNALKGLHHDEKRPQKIGRFRSVVVDRSHLLEDIRRLETEAGPEAVFDTISAIGGDNGWYYADWLWRLRGWIDKLSGGVGMRRGRKHPGRLRKGDPLDFWRVEEIIPGQKLLLRAEMKVWGKAWLEFEVIQKENHRTQLIQTAKYYPRGLVGFIYWYGIYPIHYFVFRGLIKTIAKKAERIR